MALLVIINCWRSARRLQFCVIRANWRGRVPYQEVVGGRGTVVDTSCKKMQRLQDRAASRLYRAWLPQRTWWPMGDFITLLHGWLPSSCFQGQSEAKRQEKDDSVKNNSRVWEAGEVWLAMKSGDCPSDISRLSQMWAFCSGGRISYLGKTAADPVGFACLAGFLDFLESPLPAFAWFHHSSIHRVLKSPFLHFRNSS